MSPTHEWEEPEAAGSPSTHFTEVGAQAGAGSPRALHASWRPVLVSVRHPPWAPWSLQALHERDKSATGGGHLPGGLWGL